MKQAFKALLRGGGEPSRSAAEPVDSSAAHDAASAESGYVCCNQHRSFVQETGSHLPMQPAHCRRPMVTEEDKPLAPQAPSSFYCPVSMELMSDPVMVATGHTYDRVCIEKWLAQGNRTCPVTGMRLRHLELIPNYALRTAIQVGQVHQLPFKYS